MDILTKQLYQAIKDKDLKQVKSIVKQGADINYFEADEEFNFSNSASQAILANDLAILKFLIKAGANYCQLNEVIAHNLNSGYGWGVEAEKIYNHLKKQIVYAHDLLDHCGGKNLLEFEKCIKKAINPDASYEYTVLNQALAWKSHEEVQLLLKCGANPNGRKIPYEIKEGKKVRQISGFLPEFPNTHYEGIYNKPAFFATHPTDYNLLKEYGLDIRLIEPYMFSYHNDRGNIYWVFAPFNLIKDLVSIGFEFPEEFLQVCPYIKYLQGKSELTEEELEQSLDWAISYSDIPLIEYLYSFGKDIPHKREGTILYARNERASLGILVDCKKIVDFTDLKPKLHNIVLNEVIPVNHKLRETEGL